MVFDLDKEEFRAKLEDINAFVENRDYKSALEIVETIDWRRVKNARTLSIIGEIYAANKQYEESRDLFLMAYNRSSLGKNVLGRLIDVSLKLGDFDDATAYYEEYKDIAPSDYSLYIYRYKILKEKEAPMQERIAALEEYKDKEFTDRWSYELAECYYKAGLKDKCIGLCNEMILWFGEGPYILKALELKRNLGVALSEKEKKIIEEGKKPGKVKKSEAREKPAENDRPAEVGEKAEPLKDDRKRELPEASGEEKPSEEPSKEASERVSEKASEKETYAKEEASAAELVEEILDRRERQQQRQDGEEENTGKETEGPSAEQVLDDGEDTARGRKTTLGSIFGQAKGADKRKPRRPKYGPDEPVDAEALTPAGRGAQTEEDAVLPGSVIPIEEDNIHPFGKEVDVEDDEFPQVKPLRAADEGGARQGDSFQEKISKGLKELFGGRKKGKSSGVIMDPEALTEVAEDEGALDPEYEDASAQERKALARRDMTLDDSDDDIKIASKPKRRSSTGYFTESAGQEDIVDGQPRMPEIKKPEIKKPEAKKPLSALRKSLTIPDDEGEDEYPEKAESRKPAAEQKAPAGPVSREGASYEEKTPAGEKDEESREPVFNLEDAILAAAAAQGIDIPGHTPEITVIYDEERNEDHVEEIPEEAKEEPEIEAETVKTGITEAEITKAEITETKEPEEKPVAPSRPIGAVEKITVAVERMMAGETEPAAEDVIEEAAEPVEETASEVKEAAEEVIEETSKPVEETASEVKEAVEEVIEKAAEPVEEMVSEVKEAAEEVIKEASEPVEETASEIGGAAEEVIKEISEPVEEAASEIEGAVEEVIEEVSEPVEKATSEIEGAVEEVIEEVSEPVEKAASEIEGAAEDVIKEVSEPVEEAASEIEEAAEEVIEEAPEPVKEAASEIEEATEEVIEEASEPVEDIVSEVKEAAEEVIEEASAPVAEMVSEVKEAAEEVIEEASAPVAEAASEIEGAAEEVIEKASEPAKAARALEEAREPEETKDSFDMVSKALKVAAEQAVIDAEKTEAENQARKVREEQEKEKAAGPLSKVMTDEEAEAYSHSRLFTPEAHILAQEKKKIEVPDLEVEDMENISHPQGYPEENIIYPEPAAEEKAEDDEGFLDDEDVDLFPNRAVESDDAIFEEILSEEIPSLSEEEENKKKEEEAAAAARQEVKKEPSIKYPRDHALTENETRLFSYFMKVPGMKEQILDTLVSVQNEARDKTSRTGNIIVMGGKETGKTRLISSLIPAICQELDLVAAKVAYVFAEQINGKNINNIFRKLQGGFFVIEKANQLDQETAEKLNKAMEEDHDGLIVILEDDKIGIRKMIARFPRLARKFTSTINIPVFTNDELVSFAQIYAEERGYRVESAAVLSLYDLIGQNQKEDVPMNIGSVKMIMDAAIAKAQGGIPFLKKSVNKRMDQDGKILLYKKDFALKK